MQRANSRKSSDCLQGLSSSASCSGPTTSAASRPASKRQSVDVNNLGVDDPKQVRQRAYPVSMLGAKKKDASMLRGIKGGISWNILTSLMQRFAILAAILNEKPEKTFEECVVNQLLQSMAIGIGSMLLKMNGGFSKHAAFTEHLACHSTWKEKIKRFKMGKEITSLVITSVVFCKKNTFFVLNLSKTKKRVFYS